MVVATCGWLKAASCLCEQRVIMHAMYKTSIKMITRVPFPSQPDGPKVPRDEGKPCVLVCLLTLSGRPSASAIIP